MPRIEEGSRALFVGLQGWGKTNLCEGLLLGQASAVIWDAKHRADEWLAYAPLHGYQVTQDPEDVNRYAKLVLLVDDLWLQDRAGWSRPGTTGYNWTRALMLAYDRGHTIQVHDEALATMPSVGHHPMARKAVTQGRAAGNTVFLNMQRLAWVDTMAVQTAEHVFHFWTQNDEDLNTLRKYRGIDPAPITTLKIHEFAHHQLGQPGLTLFDPIPQIIKGAKTGDVVPPGGPPAAQQKPVLRLKSDANVTAGRTPEEV